MFVEGAGAVMEDEGRLRLTIRRIIRSDAGSSEVAREIDFSPERILALIEQGHADTSAVIART